MPADDRLDSLAPLIQKDMDAKLTPDAEKTLEPGVIVRFNAGKVRFRCVGFKSAVLPRAELVFAQAMQVNGALIARGMASARITFTSNAVS